MLFWNINHFSLVSSATDTVRWVEHVLANEQTRGNFDSWGSTYFRIRPQFQGQQPDTFCDTTSKASELKCEQQSADTERQTDGEQVVMRLHKESGKRYRSEVLPEVAPEPLSELHLEEEGICYKPDVGL